MERMHSLGFVSLFRSHAQALAHVNAFDHQHPLLRLDLPGRLDFVAFRIDFDLTRLQRAGKRAGQSPARRRHHIVERGRIRGVILGPDPIVLRHLRVHPEDDRLGLGRHVREPLRPTEPLNPHPGDIRHLAHRAKLTGPVSV